MQYLCSWFPVQVTWRISTAFVIVAARGVFLVHFAFPDFFCTAIKVVLQRMQPIGEYIFEWDKKGIMDKRIRGRKNVRHALCFRSLHKKSGASFL
jgi:hypothetical protein